MTCTSSFRRTLAWACSTEDSSVPERMSPSVAVHARLPTSPHTYQRLHTSTHAYVRLPTSTNVYQRLPTARGVSHRCTKKAYPDNFIWITSSAFSRPSCEQVAINRVVHRFPPGYQSVRRVALQCRAHSGFLTCLPRCERALAAGRWPCPPVALTIDCVLYERLRRTMKTYVDILGSG